MTEQERCNGESNCWDASDEVVLIGITVKLSQCESVKVKAATGTPLMTHQ